MELKSELGDEQIWRKFPELSTEKAEVGYMRFNDVSDEWFKAASAEPKQPSLPWKKGKKFDWTFEQAVETVITGLSLFINWFAINGLKRYHKYLI